MAIFNKYKAYFNEDHKIWQSKVRGVEAAADGVGDGDTGFFRSRDEDFTIVRSCITRMILRMNNKHKRDK